MKKLILLMSVAAVMLMLVGCGSCKHDWVEATCSEPKHCSKCGKTEGFALQHKWKEATCTEPKTCELCGLTEGEPNGHVWLERTLEAPKTCSECGATEGEKITFQELELYYVFDDPEVESFVCLQHTLLYRYKDSDKVGFYGYDKKKVAVVDIVPDGQDNAYYYDVANPPQLKNGIVLTTVLYGEGGKLTICFYDEYGKEVGRMEVDTELKENERIYVRNIASGRYIRFNKTTESYGYNAFLVIDADTMTVVDKEAGVEDLGKYSMSEYATSLIQDTIDNKYTLVVAKDYSYVGYTDEYGNKVAMYKDATPFNYYGFALVSEDGENYDIVNDKLEVVGKNVLKAEAAGWGGDAVFYTRKDGKVHFYSVK